MPLAAATTISPLTRALVMTEQMLAAAQAADWEEMLRLHQAREPLLRRQHPTDPASRAQIAQVLAADLQLQALLGAARDAVTRQWQDERGRIQAIAAYVES